MPKLILTTSSEIHYYNEKFYGWMQKCIRSIEKYSNFDSNYYILIGEGEIESNWEKIKLAKMQRNVIQNKNSNDCIQHGEFIKSVLLDEETNEEDIIFFIDGDVILQRSLTEEEITKFKSIGDNEVFVGYNAGPQDTLANEYFRIQPTFKIDESMILDYSKIKVYNTGVLAMNKKTWRKLSEKYVEVFPKVENMFGHYAKQQWCISFILGTSDFVVKEIGYDIHMHSHYATPNGKYFDKNNVLHFNEKVVLFAHKWFEITV